MQGISDGMHRHPVSPGIAERAAAAVPSNLTRHSDALQLDPGGDAPRAKVSPFGTLPDEVMLGLPVHDARPLRRVNRRFATLFAERAAFDGLMQGRTALRSAAQLRLMLNGLDGDIRLTSLRSAALTELTTRPVTEDPASEGLAILTLLTQALADAGRREEALAQVDRQLLMFEDYHAEALPTLAALRQGLDGFPHDDQCRVLGRFDAILRTQTYLQTEHYVQICWHHSDLPWPPETARFLLSWIGWVPDKQMSALRRLASADE